MYTKTYIYGSGQLNRIKLKQADGYIHGFLSIKTYQNNIVSFNVYQSEFTKNNKINPSYKGLQTVMNEYKDSTTGNPDYVQIKLNDKYPNADIQFRRNSLIKNVKFISRIGECKSCMVFKIYGVRVDEVSVKSAKFTALTYNKKLCSFELNNNGIEFVKNNIYDIVGYIHEGLIEGNPIDTLYITKSRLSDLKIDFESGIIDAEQSPF